MYRILSFCVICRGAQKIMVLRVTARSEGPVGKGSGHLLRAGASESLASRSRERERTPGILVYKGLLSPGTERTGSAPGTEQMSSLAASSAARNPVQNGSNTMNYRPVDGRLIHIIQTHSLDRNFFFVFFLKN